MQHSASPPPHHPKGFDDLLNPQSPIAHRNGDQFSSPLKIKIPMQLRNRTSIGSAHSQASGSVYHESNNSMDIDAAPDEDAEGEDDEPEEPKVYKTSSRGRKIAVTSYAETDSETDPVAAGDLVPDALANGLEDDEEDEAPRPAGRRTRGKPPAIVSSDEGEDSTSRRYATRSQSKKPEPSMSNGTRRTRRTLDRQPVHTRRLTRARPGMRTRRSARDEEDADGYVDEPEPSVGSAEEEFDDAFHEEASSDIVVDPEPEEAIDGDVEADIEPAGDGRPYALRQRQKVNYAIPPPLDEIPTAPPKPRSGRGGGGRSDWNRGKKGPGWSANGAELGRFLGLPGDDSDSDAPARTPGRGLGGPAFTGGVGGILPGDLATAAGTPSNFGKVGDAALADADPLGVNQNVTFDEVGGLDDHINALKEMTLLPLLYPEVFQRFNVTPPRGVLFHGPPGTGKTLLARALAASSRSNGKGISFFMRKGADVLSKWVGEAERQLRLLFEEARNCQPSIIFFDEIDGLAPVRSSKQDQIHASIVSTLLALMDGMDGRGQVVVIGATNRPDAVDPALRRPGRFDREFYFPLPALEAREKILGIMTKKWAGWDGPKGEEQVKGLAKLTKGYGGADLRALCTEAALNAVQRRYPQIYKSNDRLLLKPETIDVELRDFMISVKKLIPSSARSSSSVASPLPPQLVPLLSGALSKVKEVLEKVMPISKKRTALEEAEWEDEGQDGALEREMMLQSMETLRVYRPRIILHGPVGMGQGYVGTAALHLLEGYHVQNLDIGTLLSDSTRTAEAAIVQLFVEAKRHQPSIIYIPSLLGWCSAVSETSRGTVRAMLETLAPTDPILLLAVVDGHFLSLPRDVRAWFGPTRDNRIEFSRPGTSEREDFFEGILKDVQRPPNQFPDGVKRKKRVLEELPIAPPLEPRQPTAAELALQEETDMRTITMLRFRLGPILTELKRKFKRFTKRATEEYHFPIEDPEVEIVVPQIHTQTVETVTTTIDVQSGPNGVVETVNEERVEIVNGIAPPPPAEQPAELPPIPVPTPPPAPAQPLLYNMDLERMHAELHKNRYLTPQDFLNDVGKMVHNAEVCRMEDPERLHRAQAMFTAAEVSIQDFDHPFRLECERMAKRELQRRRERKKQRQKEKEADAEANGSNSDVYPPGTRRSARHNGQEPEIAITDPLKVERAARLKRQRSNEASNDSQGSGDENGETRGSKRSRVASVEDDPMNIGPSNSQQVHSAVHFAPDGLPPPPAVYALPNGPNFDSAGLAVPNEGGFDPRFLHPIPPMDGFMLPSNSGPVSPSSSATPVPSAPTIIETLQQPEASSSMRSPSPRPPVPESQPGTWADVFMHPTKPVAPEPAQEQEPVPEPEPQPMEVEREPSPHPDFNVDEAAFVRLRHTLRDSTDVLNVEQLEQLRAACLGRVWGHRSAWDRDDLVRELQQLVTEFVEEVRADEDMASSP
ncbi:AAA-domain-containing protein [Artomyces pyxidatus]|uniref:AAA-domain-containing protein n=1 Tax=Artomyces pyxidatus TaxID=48021 RepID=A0ACB8SSG0_9AGAM|nr:AAA-domain-containing protein [Artomyces pyxidatus]